MAEDDVEMQESGGPSTSQRISRHRTTTTTVPLNEQNLRMSKIGRIRKMHLKNFMCHSNLVVEFNERVNIIVGNNGSGKSAILTALVVGMGCTAAAASRGTSIKNLVKRGETSATIEIHLMNDGLDSYEPEVYGDTIIISRHITASGCSTYKIKNSRGANVSQSVSDMRQILMYMNVQVDNPICVLNQEASRTFLKECDENKRYKLFLKATQIETVLNKLDECVEIYAKAKTSLGLMEKQRDIQMQEYHQQKEKYKQLLSVESLKGNVNILNQEMSWCHVREQENIIKDLERQIEEFDKNLEDFRNKANNQASILANLQEKIGTLEAEIGQQKLDYVAKKTACDEKRHTYKEQNNKLTSETQSVKLLESRRVHLSNEIDQLQKSIEERSGDQTQRVNELRRSNEIKLLALAEKRDEQKHMAENSKRDLEIMKNNIEQNENMLDQIRERRKTVVERESQLSAQVRQLNAKNSTRLNIYGNFMQPLIDSIQRHHKRGEFTEMPRGPLGNYIEVPNDKWRPMVEQIIGGHLRAFCVTNSEDSRKLNHIIKTEFPGAPRFTVIISKFCHKLYDISNGLCKPPRGTTLLIDEMQISDPVVANVLIDQTKCEKILLCDNSREAQHYTSDIQNVPQNLIKILAREPFAEFCPAPNYRSYGLVLKPCRLLQQNLEELKLQLESELRDTKLEINGIDTDWKRYQAELNKIQNTMADRRQHYMAIDREVRAITEKIMELKNFEYPNEELQLEMLRKEVLELEATLESLLPKISEKRIIIDRYKIEVNQLERDITDFRKTVADLETLLQRNSIKYTKCKEDINELKRTDRYSETEIKRIEDEKKKIQKRVDLTAHKCQELKLAAEANGERIDHGRSVAEIKELVKSLESKIRSVCSIKDDINVVKELMKTKKEIYEKTKISVDETADILKLRILQVRNFRGNMEIDNRNYKLQLNIIPQDKNTANAVSNTKSLSGGERSFSTIAFLLSLWSCVSQPFYCLDEYDVFTDQLNRNIMTNLLLNEAQKRSDRQFCFLTPQDMSFVKESPDITFHSLEDHTRTNSI